MNLLQRAIVFFHVSRRVGPAIDCEPRGAIVDTGRASRRAARRTQTHCATIVVSES